MWKVSIFMSGCFKNIEMGIIMDKYKEILRRIAHQVLEEDYNKYEVLYLVRLEFLYTLMLEETGEAGSAEALEALICEITDFEISTKYGSFISLPYFKNMTVESIFILFSSMAFDLAVLDVQGRSHRNVAAFTKEIFDSFMKTPSFLNQKVFENNKMTVSETILDLLYASHETDCMSFRLKKQCDYMGIMV